MSNTINLKKARLLDLPILQAFCKKIYPIYFASYWENEGLALYLEEQYGTDRLQSDLQNDQIDYCFICDQFYERIGFRYHLKTRLPYQHFKEELKGIDTMILSLAL